MPKNVREVFRYQKGNVLGVVLEPMLSAGEKVPKEKWTVRIGVADKRLAADLPFTRDDIQQVIKQLKEWIHHEGIKIDNGSLRQR